VHLSVFLHGARFDFAARLTATLIFVKEHQARRCVVLTVVRGSKDVACVGVSMA